MNRKCEFCDKDIKPPRRKFCSQNCCNKWFYHNDQGVKDRTKKRTRQWELDNLEKKAEYSKKSLAKFRKNNPERFNTLMMDGYRRNKKKWQSRNAIRRILNGKGSYVQYNPLKKKCKCGSVENLEIHSEGCPTRKADIVKDIDEGRIYYRCRKCNRATQSHGKSQKTSKEKNG